MNTQPNNQHDPRDFDSVIAARYWLTDKGIAATDRIRAAQAEGEDA